MKCELARSRAAELLAFTMVLAASSALELVTLRTHGWDQTHLTITLAWTAVAMAIYGAMSWARAPRVKPFYATGALVLVMGLALLCRRLGTDEDKPDLPLELFLLASLRDTALVAAGLGRIHSVQRMAATSSLSVAVLAFALGSGGRLFGATLVCLVAGVGWLMAGAWLQTQGRAAPSTRVSLPWLPLAATCAGAVLLVLAAALVYPEQIESLETFATSWQRLSPKSLSAFQRGRRSLQSSFQTMADLTDLKYGDAEVGGVSAAGATGGAGDASSSSLAQLMGSGFVDAGSGGPNALRRFSLVRRGPAVEIPESAVRQALFQTSRQLPLHMPVTTYDRFDGVRWRPEQSFLGMRMTSQLFDGKGQTTIFPDLSLSLDPREMAQAQALADEAAGNGSGDFIDEARRQAARMLAQWAGGGRVVEPEIREMSTTHLNRLLNMPPHGELADSQYLITPYDLAKLTEQLQKDPQLLARFQEALSGDKQENAEAVLREYLHWRCEEGNTVLPLEVSRLLTKWIAGKRPGWDQMEAVALGLRGHCAHDPEASVPASAVDPTYHFLLRSRRGPDYMFASTAAVLLRSLGYRARMVGGFYARPEKRSFWTGRSAVHAEDVHYWTQARLGDGSWVDLEPTPGYEMPRAEVPWSEWAAGLFSRASGWSLSWQQVLVAVLSALVVAFALRRRIADRLATALWRTRLFGNANRSVLATWRLIERRARLVRRWRQPGTTLQTWAGQLASHRPEAHRSLVELAEMADWAAHAPGGLESYPQRSRTEVRALCRSAVACCTVALLRTPSMTSRARSARPSHPTLPTRGLPDDSHQQAILLRRRRRQSAHRLVARCP